MAEVIGFGGGWEFGIFFEMDFKVIAGVFLWTFRHGVFHVEDI